VAIIVILVAAPQAQQPAPALVAAATPPPAGMIGIDAPMDVDLLVGRSTILNIGAPIARVSLTVPDIADAMVTTPSQLLIHGKQPGTISLFVWDRAGAIKTFEVKVRRDLTPLVGHFKQLFPTENITVMGSGKDVVLSGTVGSKYVVDKASDIASGYVDKKENVVNLLQVKEGVASNQVMLRVRFAEVSRNALQEVGVSLFADNKNSRWFGRTTTQQFAAPYFDLNHPSAALGDTLVFSDYLNLFLFDAKNSIGGVVKALQTKGVFQSLAEPNLIALNGKEATFLAGGEFPYPVPQGNFGAFTIHFKEYGVRLKFTPTVLGSDLINLKLAPEVSSLDFANAVVIEGFRIPALTSRRTETEIELRDGQTFAIAGLMNNSALSSMRKVPGIGDIPVLGLLFKSRAYQKDQTELVVMVTPHIVRRDSPGVSEGLPSLVEPYLGAPNKTLPNPDPYVGSPRYPANRPAPTPAPAPAPAPAANQPQAQSSAPVQSQQPVTQPQAPAANSPSADHTPQADQQTPTTPLTREQLRAIEQAREEERKAAEKAARDDAQQRKAMEAAERARVEQEKRDEKRRAEQAKKDEERQKRESEAAKKNSDQTRKQAEEEQKRQRALAEAAVKLKQAQDAYQLEVAKSNNKGGSQ
jgi:pilus assembly protein CpaC